MAAIQIKTTTAQHVSGTTRIVRDVSGRPILKERKAAETDHDGSVAISTRDGSKTILRFTPEGDVTISIRRGNAERLIAAYNQREFAADMLGAEYEEGIATYTDNDGNVTVMQPEEYYASLEEAQRELEERQRANAAYRASLEEQDGIADAILPPGQPAARPYGKRAIRS